ncbi:hypothetical protein D1872_173280 [compost metagenome]
MAKSSNDSLKKTMIEIDKDLWSQFGLSAALMEASGDYGRVTKRRLLEAALRYATLHSEQLLKEYDE